MTFDARAAKLLKTGEHIIFTDHPGLRLEATARFRTWIYRFKSPLDGRMKQVKLGRWPELSYHSAVAAWEEASTSRAGGKDLAVERKAARAELRAADDIRRERERTAAVTVRRVCDAYCDHIDRVRKEKGAKEVRRMFKTMLDEGFASLPIEAITRANAFDLLESYVSTPVQAGKLRAELGGAWDHALDAGRIPDSTPNWWRQVMRGKLRSKGRKIQKVHIGTVKRALTVDELKLLLPWMPNFSRNVCDALTLYLWTACRGSEIVQIEAEEISEEEGVLWWTCPKAKTKNARHANATDHRVPLFGKAREIVARRRAVYPSGYLFRSQMGSAYIQQKVIGVAVHWHMPYSTTTPDRERPRLPVVRWAPHDLRRTARTGLAALGCPHDVAEAILGHMQPGVSGIYNCHRYDAERAEWLGKWDTWLNSLS